MTAEFTIEQMACLEGCRSYEQYKEMRAGFEANRCIFCELDRVVNTVLWEDELSFGWAVPSAFMRDTLDYHALFVPKRHVRFEIELTDAEVLSLHQAKRTLHKQFGYAGGLTHVREGDMRMNSGTVPHLHYNTITPNRASPVQVTVYKMPNQRAADRVRLAAWSDSYERGSEPA